MVRMKFPKGTGRKYFDLYYDMYPLIFEEGRLNKEQMDIDLKDFENKLKKGEIKNV